MVTGSGLMGRVLTGSMKLWKASPAKVDVGDAISKAQSNLVTTLGGKLVRLVTCLGLRLPHPRDQPAFE